MPCGRATARPARPRTEPSPTCRWPAERIEQLRAVLRGDKLLPATVAGEIVRALPHGHVLAALGNARRIALTPCCRAAHRNAMGLQPTGLTRGRLVLALIVAACSSGGQAGDRAECWIPPPPAIRWRGCWGSARSPPSRSMPRSTGWAAGGPLQPSLFDSPTHGRDHQSRLSGRRLVSARTRCWPKSGPRTPELLATDKELAALRPACGGRAQPAARRRGDRPGGRRSSGTGHMAKHFPISLGEDIFSFTKTPSARRRAALDGSM